MNGIERLAKSSRAWAAVVAIVALFAINAWSAHPMTTAELGSLIRWIVIAFLAGTAAEDGAKALARRAAPDKETP